jgi:hypothetical protein
MTITLKQIKDLGRGEIISYSEKEALEAVKQYGHALQYVKDQTPEICLEAVKQDGHALQYVDKSIFSEKPNDSEDIIEVNGVKYKKID